MAFGHFLLGSHNFTVTALGLCVKWSLVHVSPYLHSYSLLHADLQSNIGSYKIGACIVINNKHGMKELAHGYEYCNTN